MFKTHESFELALNITALLPCLLLILLYIIDINHLKYPNYFKFELMLVMLVIISLNFVKEYEKKEIFDDHCGENFKMIGILKSYLEIVNLCFLASFNYLLYSLIIVKNKKKKSISSIIILSLINWIGPAYIFILYFIWEKNFISISGQCIFIHNIKKYIHLFLIPIIFLLDIIFFALTIRVLKIKKQKDEEHSDNYSDNIIRITLNFISHLILFASQYINNILIFDTNNIKDDSNKLKFYHINYYIALSIINIVCCLESKTRDYYYKFLNNCLKLNTDSNSSLESETIEESDEEIEIEEVEDDDEQNEHMKIYRESSTQSE